MLKNYLKVSLRKFYRQKLYSLINLAGLSLAIACCLILALYLRSELTYDQHNVNHERIYRIAHERITEGNTEQFAYTSQTFAPMMAEEFNEIEEAVILRKANATLFRYEDQLYYWDVYVVGPNVFDVFSHDVIYGDPDTALVDGFSLAVSETFAKRYFGDENPIGEVLTSETGEKVSITLVFADLPENTHLKYDALFSNQRPAFAMPESLTARRQSLWGLGTYNYLMMSADFDPDDFASMSSEFYERHMAAEVQEYNMAARFWLEPLADIHLNSDLQYDLPGGNRAYLYAFAAVALFILVVACINYINLATARSMRHAKEVGMRKILGARKGALTLQFMVEALAFALVASVVGVILVEILLTLTPINELLGKSLNFSLLNEPKLVVWLLAFSVIVGLLTGLYPALYLSSWAPLSALVSSSGGNSKSNAHLRQGLVLAQFTVSIAVVACTLLMANQMRYLSDKSLGFDKENRVSITMIGRDLLKRIPIIKTELLQQPDILGVATSSALLGQDTWIGNFEIETNEGTMISDGAKYIQADIDYLKVMGMNLVAGRDFSQRLLTDVGLSFVVNEAMVQKMAWDEPLGKRISGGRVIGVVEDFHFQSLHSTLDPFFIIPFNDDWENMGGRGFFDTRYMMVNIAGEGVRDTLAYLSQRFAEFDPKHPFQFEFLDESLDSLYQSEQRLMKLIGLFSGICIFIACLGLFGLASFTTEQRSKEIGIRKVLGANIGQIILLLSHSSLVLVAIGSVIASVIAYLVIDKWLSGFAFHTDISMWAFVIASATALLVAYITIALQSFKTARSNPIESLRYE